MLALLVSVCVRTRSAAKIESKLDSTISVQTDICLNRMKLQPKAQDENEISCQDLYSTNDLPQTANDAVDAVDTAAYNM